MVAFRRAAAYVAALVMLGATLAACGTTPQTGASQTLRVVAGENFWGSVAAQLGGDRVQVTSVVANPNADPHQYASSANTARTFANANYVILNGAGYDDWGQQLLDANPVAGRQVFTVATFLGKKAGDNPHFWYNPADVARVVAHITADYQALAPRDAAYFAQQYAAFTTALQPYNDLLAAIKTKYAGRAVGATESIFVYLAQALGLNLISPPAFMEAVAEGNDPSADSVATFQQQIQRHQISVLVYNTQTVTDVTDTLKQMAATARIPLVPISETMEPATTTFQAWQTAQLTVLEQALQATTPGA